MFKLGAALLAALLVPAAALAQAPSPAQLGISNNTPTNIFPQVLSVLDSSRTWAQMGTIDPVAHVFAPVTGALLSTLSPATLGVTPTATPEQLLVRDSSGAWLSIGTVASGSFTFAPSSPASAPVSPAQIGITPTQTVSVLDNTRSWVTIGNVDATAHTFAFTGVSPPPVVIGVSAAKIGPGGLLSQIQIAADGTQLARTDTNGCFLRDNPGQPWRQLILPTTIPASLITPDSSDGCYEAVYAPTNAHTLLAIYSTILLISNDRGVTWRGTSFPGDSNQTANQNGKFAGPHAAFDPVNPNIIFADTPTGGLFRSTNQGATWTAVSGVPGGTVPSGGSQGGGNPLAYDPASPVVGGVTQTLYAGSYGNGVYVTTSGGTSFTSIGGPMNVNHIAVSSLGVYATEYGTPTGAIGYLWRWNGSAWSTVGVDPSYNCTPSYVAINPNNVNEVAVLCVAGEASVSADGGTTWTGYPQLSFAGTDVPWIPWAQSLAPSPHYMTGSSIAFDPTQSNTLYESAGLGVWQTIADPTLTPTSTMLWTDTSFGIEQMGGNMVVMPPGGSPQYVAWDRPEFNLGPLNAYPQTYNPLQAAGSAIGIVGGWTADYNWANPATMVGIFNWDAAPYAALSSFSYDGGQTWQLFDAPPPPEANGLVYGMVAIDDQNDVVDFPCVSIDGHPFPGNAWRTTLPGDVWTMIMSANTGGWCNAYYLYRKTVTADKKLSQTFYAYHEVDGCYASTDGGLTWAVRSSKQFDNAIFNATMKASPTTAGELFFTSGPITSTTQPVDSFFWHSTDGCNTWTQVPNVKEVRMFGFGPPAPGQTSAAIYIDGWVSQPCGYQYGLWQSQDDAVTWIPLEVTASGSCPPAGDGQWRFGQLGIIKDILGDPDRYGVIYAAMAGMGILTLPGAVNSPRVGNQTVVRSVAGQLTINWKTDTNAANVLHYGPTSAYGTNISASSGLTPSAVIAGLGNYQTVHYQVQTGSSKSFDLVTHSLNSIPPNAPTGLTATTIDDIEIDLAWNYATGDPMPIGGYRIYANGALVGTTQFSYVHAFAFIGQPATAYTFTVQAFDADGNQSPMSGSASATTQAAGVTWAETASPAAINISSTATIFTAQPIGPAAANRLVLACVSSGHGAVNVTGVKIAGVTATKVVQQTGSSGSDDNSVGLFQAAIPTGTTADIEIDTTNPSGGVSLLVGALGTPTQAAVSTAVLPFPDYLNYPNPHVTTTPLNIPAYGIGIICISSDFLLTANVQMNDNAVADSHTDGLATGLYQMSVLGHQYKHGLRVISVGSDPTNGPLSTSMATAAWGGTPGFGSVAAPFNPNVTPLGPAIIGGGVNLGAQAPPANHARQPWTNPPNIGAY